MSDESPTPDQAEEIESLRQRLQEADELLRAIRQGEVDALLISEQSGDRVYTLRTADAPYRALVEQMQEGAVTVTTNADIVYANGRFASLINVPLQRVIGASIDQFVEATDRGLLRGLISAGSGNLRTKLRARGKSSLDANISVSSVTLDGAQHRTLIVSDMSTLTRVQRESRSKDEFLAMLAHELRNPLGAIGGAVQVLSLSELQDPRAVQARDIISRQTMHMARLVDDLLDVGRVVTGKIELERQPIDLADFVRTHVSALLSGEQRDREVILSAESVWVNADPVRAEQIVGNLLSNALKFTPPDRPVRVSVSSEGPNALLRVTDEGSGIDTELLPQVFDLFVQGPATVDRARGGLGIGLTLVHRLVELHGGTIEAFSAGKDQGSTFTVRLPATEPWAGEEQGLAHGASDRLRVLLVDDNSDSREMYAFLLQADGHDVHEAEDGTAALAAFHKTMPDVAIIDIGLPGIDGYEVARRMRADAGQGLTLIALTGYGFPEDRERSRAAGFDRHLVKPVAPDDLKQELMKIRPQLKRTTAGQDK
jgi:signal transduction histidine kinase/ActR/RegA family two-component response regulator